MKAFRKRIPVTPIGRSTLTVGKCALGRVGPTDGARRDEERASSYREVRYEEVRINAAGGIGVPHGRLGLRYRFGQPRVESHTEFTPASSSLGADVFDSAFVSEVESVQGLEFMYHRGAQPDVDPASDADPVCHFVSGPELVCRYASGPKCWYESVSRSSFAAGPERERGRFPDQPRQRACEWRGPERHVRVGYFELFEQQLAIPIMDGAAAGAVAMAVLA